MIIQIYEIQHPIEAIQVVDAGVSHVGTVLQCPSEIESRTLQETIASVKACRALSSVIPLFREEAAVCRAVETLGFDILHLCDELLDPAGNPMDPECFLALQRVIRRRFPGLRITRSIPVPPVADEAVGKGILHLARRFEQVSDLLLLDTWMAPLRRPVDGFIGITGVPCDWRLSETIVRSVAIPVILAGGLGPENVSEAISRVRPAGVDSCTRTNACDAQGKPIRFVKDMEKVRTFVQNAKRAFAQSMKGASDHV